MRKAENMGSQEDSRDNKKGAKNNIDATPESQSYLMCKRLSNNSNVAKFKRSNTND